MTEKTHYVSEKKKKIAENIQKLILKYPIIAAVDMENLPTPQLQQMRSQLRDKIEMTMSKRRIIKHAIEGIKDKKKNIEQLEQHLKGMPALIFTKENPFLLFKTLKKSKTSAPAKPGQTAPFDIKIPKGPTPFAPGPVIGELAQLGIKSGVEGGKVVIKEDSIIVKEGEKIPAKAAEILTRLDIKPMEVGLNITAVYENGDIFTKDILDIDEEEFIADLQKAASGSLNLAINIEYPTKETIDILIGKAFNDAKALGLSQEIIEEGIIEGLLSKAKISALSLKSTAKIEAVEKPKEEPKAEEEKPKEAPKVEEKKPEEKPKEEPKVEIKEISTPEIKEEPTPTERKEEKILEEEKEIIKEEEKLEEVKKPKIEAPIEKEVEKEIKKEEEKQLEEERIKKEKELEKIEEQKKAEEEAKRKEEQRKAEEKKRLEEEQRKKQEEERKAKEEAKKKEEERKRQEEAKKQKPQDETDRKIAEMVAKTKKFVKGEIPDAEKLVEEAGKLAAKEVKKEVKEEVKEKEPKVEEKPREAPKVQEKIPSIQELKEKKKEDIEKKKKEQEEVENLAQELIKKGTLRK